MKNKYFYPIFKLKAKSWIRYWLLKKTEFKGKLSEILTGFSFNLQNTLRQKFVKFEIEGNSIQDGEPSPENEVPILSSGDNGSITEKIVNKNLCYIEAEGKYRSYSTGNYVTTSDYNSYIAEVEENTDYMVKSFNNMDFSNLCFFDQNMKYISGLAFWGSTNKKITTVENCKYVTIAVKNTENQFMITKGTTIPTDYVPHQEQTYSIYTQQPMRSIGDVRDCFVKKSDGWYERHNIKRLVFDGTENWQVNGHIFYIQIADKIQQKLEVLSNNYRYSTLDWVNIDNYEISTQNNNTFIFIRDDNYGTKVEFNTHLAEKYANGHPLYIDYLSQEPLNLPCTQSQIDILENLPITYEGQTNIYSIDEVVPYLEIQYWESDTNG